MFETDWRKAVTDSAERKVFEALEDPRWEWRTVAALSRESGLPENEVRRILGAYPSIVRRSIIPSQSGADLFTLQRSYFDRQGTADKIRLFLAPSSSNTTSSKAPAKALSHDRTLDLRYTEVK